MKPDQGVHNRLAGHVRSVEAFPQLYRGPWGAFYAFGRLVMPRDAKDAVPSCREASDGKAGANVGQALAHAPKMGKTAPGSIEFWWRLRHNTGDSPMA